MIKISFGDQLACLGVSVKKISKVILEEFASFIITPEKTTVKKMNPRGISLQKVLLHEPRCGAKVVGRRG